MQGQLEDCAVTQSEQPQEQPEHCEPERLHEQPQEPPLLTDAKVHSAVVAGAQPQPVQGAGGQAPV